MADAYTKLLLHFNGEDEATSTYDSSPSEHTITFQGTAQLDTAWKWKGLSSLLLDGNSDDLTVSDHADWDRGAGDYTIDARIRLNGKNKLQGIIGKNSAPTYYQLMFRVSAGNYLEGMVDDTAHNLYYSRANNLALDVDTDYHVAMVVNRSTNKIQLFVNGVETTYSEQDTIAGTAYTNNVPLIIGSLQENGASSPFDGHIDELRISKGIARWTSDFTPPTEEYPGLYLCSGSITAQSALTGDTKVIETLAGSLDSASGLTGLLNAIESLDGEISASSACTGELIFIEALGGVIAAQSGLTGNLQFCYGSMPPEMHAALIDPYSGGAWLWLIEISIIGYEPIRMARNTVDVTYGGVVYSKNNFEIGLAPLSGDGSVPHYIVKVLQDADHTLEDKMNATQGAGGGAISVIRAHEDFLTIPIVELEQIIEILTMDSDTTHVYFQLGMPNPLTQRIPLRLYSSKICPYATATLFKGPECQYDGEDVICDGTFEDCYTKGNAVNWGGELGLDPNSIRI